MCTVEPLSGIIDSFGLEDDDVKTIIVSFGLQDDVVKKTSYVVVTDASPDPSDHLPLR